MTGVNAGDLRRFSFTVYAEALWIGNFAAVVIAAVLTRTVRTGELSAVGTWSESGNFEFNCGTAFALAAAGMAAFR